MLFNSIEFLVFFPLVLFIYFILPHKYRIYHLLTASYIFYMFWRIEYVILILLSTFVDYYAAIFMDKSSSKEKRRFWLIVSLFVNLGLLFTFKYFNFFIDSASGLFGNFGYDINLPYLNILLPVGISFYTFQTLSYTIEVYRGQQTPEKNIFNFALYVSFFPQLVAGPIERSINLLPQLKKKINFEYDRVKDGLLLMLWGFFKKLVIADNIARIVNPVYNNVHEFSGVHFVIAGVFFAFQLYCDFSGYSDIAIGAAQCMGIKLMKNFDRPFYSKSISEFWTRWHISLSSWFRDYLYIPLGGSRVKIKRYYFNLLITFIICGLWHGANWTFVIWGGINGFYLIYEVLTKNIRAKIVVLSGLNKLPNFHKIIQILITFMLTCFGLIFFRANNLSDAVYIVTHIFDGTLYVIFRIGSEFLFGLNSNSFFWLLKDFNISVYHWNVIIISIIILESVQLIQRKGSVREVIKNKPTWLRWTLYYTIIFIVLIFGNSDSVQFYYFQF